MVGHVNDKLTSVGQVSPEPVLTMRPKAVLSTISSDCHTWNLVFLQLLLEEHGHQVVNCGPCVPARELAERCAVELPQLLVISTVNGHGFIEASDYVRCIRNDPRLHGLRVVIGGKLGINGSATEAEIAKLIAVGYDAVFIDDRSSIAQFSDYLKIARPAAGRQLARSHSDCCE